MSNSKHAKQGSDFLREYRLSQELQHISVTVMLQDPSNRDEEGVNINEVLKKAAGIEGQGFDPSKARVVVVQMPLDQQRRDKIFKKNREWKELDPRYPDFDEKVVEYSVVGGNHLVVGMQMMRQETLTDSFCSVSKNGGPVKMSLSLLESMDADYAKAVCGTVPCVVLRREVRDEVGALQSIQVSENQTHVLNTLESDKQCILRCAAWIEDGTLERLGEIKLLEQLKKEFPHLGPHIEGYYTFVQQLGGLSSRHFKHWKQSDTRFTENLCILRGSLMAKIAKDIPVTTPRVKRATAVAARKFMCVRVMEACVHICMYVCMYVWTYVCMSVSIHVCMYVCVCICMYIDGRTLSLVLIGPLGYADTLADNQSI